MNKIEGLKLLTRHFPQNAIDSSFLQSPDELPVLFARYGEAEPDSYWRIRCANPHGSEFGLPMGSFYSNADAERFVQETAARHPEYAFIFHRINDLYYYPNYCGTIEVSSFDRFELTIELQYVTREMIDTMDSGVRPRDWPTCICLRQDAAQPEPVLVYGEVGMLEKPLRALYKIAVKLCWLYASCGSKTVSYTRFNICRDGSIVLNDHRGSTSFVETAGPQEQHTLLFSLNTDGLSLEQMCAELRQRYRVSMTTAADDISTPPPEARGRLLRGLGASRGTAVGRAFVLDNVLPEEGSIDDSIRENIVLVCKTMTPELIALSQKVSGIVTDQGGISSHAAILSRELGIPCVTSTRIGTKLIQNGDRVQIDGLTGEVYYEPSRVL